MRKYSLVPRIRYAYHTGYTTLLAVISRQVNKSSFGRLYLVYCLRIRVRITTPVDGDQLQKQTAASYIRI